MNTSDSKSHRQITILPQKELRAILKDMCYISKEHVLGAHEKENREQKWK